MWIERVGECNRGCVVNVYIKDNMLKKKIMAKREFLREYIMRSTKKIYMGRALKTAGNADIKV